MDSAVLLDLLGNENRRRILRLLAHKPCYVTEISEYLGVSPKAVIDHLRKLEQAGLIESRTDDQRRKYFHISRNLRLEVNVSPYGFGAKSAYPANPSLDMTGRCPHVSFEIESDEGDADAAEADAEVGTGVRGESEEQGDSEVEELAAEFSRLEELENELSLAQRYVHGRMTDVLDRLSESIGADADSRFYANLLAAVATGERSVSAISDEVNAPPEIVEDSLYHLADRGLVRSRDGEWRIA